MPTEGERYPGIARSQSMTAPSGAGGCDAAVGGCSDNPIESTGGEEPRRIDHGTGLAQKAEPQELAAASYRPRGVPVFEQVRRLANGLAAHPVGRKRPLRSVANIVAWKLRSRLFPGPHRVKFVNGSYLWARPGETGVTGNVYYGLHEFEDMAFVAHALRPGDLFGDVGANAGSYSVIAAAVAGARVIAVEPVRDSLARLRANIALNGIGDLTRVEDCALTKAPGTIAVTTSRDTMNHVVCNGEITDAEEVPARTADDVFSSETPFVMKIDVEGHEASVLAGAARLLKDPALSALLVEVSRASRGAVVKMLSEARFEPRKYDPQSRQLSLSPASIGNGNTLFVRAGSEGRLAERLADAEPIQVQDVRI